MVSGWLGKLSQQSRHWLAYRERALTIFKKTNVSVIVQFFFINRDLVLIPFKYTSYKYNELRSFLNQDSWIPQ